MISNKLQSFVIISLILAIPFFSKAQVTTSSISGIVKGSNDATLEGSSIKATHTPTGAVYTTASRKNGRFDIVNMTPGGPYTIEISNIGYTDYKESNIWLMLGENTRVDPTLATSATELNTVVVTGTSSGATARRKTGASTSIGKERIASLPTLSRSLQDYTRLTPQANGNSFGGMNNRYNNITIDGAVNNDVFGLTSGGTPGAGSGTTPISLDAIQEIQVQLAPYDVSNGNFTGAGINAITRSGTNNYEGSVYYFVRNQDLIGKDPITRIKSTDFTDKQYGVRLGGPIIKNKLFFFVNGEIAKKTIPTLYNAGETGSVITVEEAEDLTAALNTSTYNNYDVGGYGVYNAATESNKIFGRIDWNVNNKHHLTLRHNYIDAFDDNITRSTTLFRFGNNAYRIKNSQNISVLELRSKFSRTISNNLILGLHRIRDARTPYGDVLPSIEITKGSGVIQLGSERSSLANELDQDIFEITDNLKIFKGKHTFTLGTHNEFFKFRNLFINNLNGRWRFASLADFYANQPRQFEVSYSPDIVNNPKPAAKFSAAQLGFYAQDEIQVNPKFRVTLGFRVDVPVIGDTPPENALVTSFYEGKYNTQDIPKNQLLYAPRVGFNYDVEGDRKLIVRGGVGVFSGRVPFVWISNQFGGATLKLRSTSQVDDSPNSAPYTVNEGNGFNPNFNEQSSIGTGVEAATYEVNLFDKKFKLPQVLRINAATDVKLDGGFNLTIEALYSKTINNVFYQDINLLPPVGVVDPTYNNGFDKRIAYGASNATRRANPTFTNALLLTNTNKGYSYNIGATLNKTWKHIFAQVAYNHNGATDVSSGTNSTALSNWERVAVAGNPNDPQLATSNYQLKHRISAVFSANIEYAKRFKTSIGLFYSGNSGQGFTYITNGDLNSDGRSVNDLIYVPRDASEIKFVDRLNSAGTAVVRTAAEQSADFQAFIDNDPYLSKRRGMYTERNGRSTPWEHVIDARISQDISMKVGSKIHAIQLTFDIFNLTNLLNNDWGRQYFNNDQVFTILNAINRTSGAFPGKGFNFTNQAPWSMSFGSRWQGQFGVRYTFN
ncbi:MAG: carboxypeptidase regulatory-like domain-containing protein [Bacteroidota bacterium]